MGRNLSIGFLLSTVGSALVLGYLVANEVLVQPIAMVLGIGMTIMAFIKIEWALYVLIFSMLLSPEIPVASTTDRSVVIRLDDILLVLLTLAWLVRSAIFKDVGLVFKTPLNKSIASYFVICLLSTGIGMFAERMTVMVGVFTVLKYFEYFLIFFLVVNNIRDREQIHRYVVALLITAAIVSVIAIFQIPTGARVTAPFEGEHGEPNTLGGYLVLMIT